MFCIMQQNLILKAHLQLGMFSQASPLNYSPQSRQPVQTPTDWPMLTMHWDAEYVPVEAISISAKFWLHWLKVRTRFISPCAHSCEQISQEEEAVECLSSNSSDSNYSIFPWKMKSLWRWRVWGFGTDGRPPQLATVTIARWRSG
jgi:hypothetical protein